MSEAPMNIYQRLNEIRKKVPYVQKSETKVAGKYRAVTHDAVTGHVREFLIEFGVIIVPRLISSVVSPTGTTTSGGIPYIRYEARYEVDFVNMDDPQDKVTVPNESHAMDEGDKAPGKALSYATKYAMLKLLSIETGEEDEDRDPDAKPEVITQEQQFELHAYCEEHGLNGDETLKAMATKAFQLKAINELPKDRFDEAKELLKLKVKSIGTAKPGVEGSKGGKDNGK